MISFLIGAATFLYVIVCILLIVIVLMQESRGGGLASAFGGSGLDLAFGAGIGRKMSRFTVILAVIFMVLSIILAVVKLPNTVSVVSPPPAVEVPEQPPAEDTQKEAPKDNGEIPPGNNGSSSENETPPDSSK
ncbi:MAG: preprotein translocase subunit SecG [Planctomycetota bacterium]